MNDDKSNPTEEGTATGASQASVEFNKRRAKPRKRKGGRKVVKKTKKAKKSVERRGKAYEIVAGRPASKYPIPRKGSVPAAIWAALKSKKRATAKELSVAIVGKIAPASAK
ncbi:hypothetical protein LCGC14_2698820, partial [marine sediment metagenome]